MPAFESPSLTRRALFRLTAAVGPAAFVPLVACGPIGAQPAAQGGAKKPVTINYWVKWGGTSEEPENAVITNFQQKFPHVTVVGTEDTQIAGTGRGDREKFIAALAAGVPPT